MVMSFSLKLLKLSVKYVPRQYTLMNMAIEKMASFSLWHGGNVVSTEISLSAICIQFAINRNWNKLINTHTCRPKYYVKIISNTTHWNGMVYKDVLLRKNPSCKTYI